jgi:uncharacterized membrane protein SpoIIM required for sporulation
MVIEQLADHYLKHLNKWRMFLVGFLFSTIAILLSLWIFFEQASLIMVFLTVLLAVPVFYHTIKREERLDEGRLPEGKLLKEHSRALSCLMFLFVGMVLSTVLWYVILPDATVLTIFQEQTNTIQRINSPAIGSFWDSLSAFQTVFLHNFRVFVLCILFAFIFGFGAIFILAWNATILGSAIGNIIRNGISLIGKDLGMNPIYSYFHIISYGLLRYSIHGIPEILAYFGAGLAGGIISIAAIRHKIYSEKFRKIVFDSSNLLILSILLLVAAGLLEVYITPLLF